MYNLNAVRCRGLRHPETLAHHIPNVPKKRDKKHIKDAWIAKLKSTTPGLYAHLHSLGGSIVARWKEINKTGRLSFVSRFTPNLRMYFELRTPGVTRSAERI